MPQESEYTLRLREQIVNGLFGRHCITVLADCG